MKHLIPLGLLLTAPIWAAEPGLVEPVCVRLDVLQVSDEAAEELQGRTRFPKGLPLPGKVLQTADLMTLTDRSSQFTLGRKHPIVYYDPRGAVFQINYVDSGFKLDFKCKSEKPGVFLIYVYPEFSVVDSLKTAGTAPNTATYPQTSVFQAHSNEIPQVVYGESLVVGRIHGSIARTYLNSMGLPAQASGYNLMMLLTVNRP